MESFWKNYWKSMRGILEALLGLLGVFAFAIGTVAILLLSGAVVLLPYELLEGHGIIVRVAGMLGALVVEIAIGNLVLSMQVRIKKKEE